MRRRSGHETSELRDAKLILVTSNEKLVRRAVEILRDNKALGPDKRVIGPAIHQRTIAGLVFANSGLAEKKEISRRQLLAACARVVMLRPKMLERLRLQISLLNRPEDAAIVDALISQPRASEIIMDRSVGRGRPISASNVEETIAAIKETAADALRRQYDPILISHEPWLPKRQRKKAETR
jgi:flagella basal body P-ring formation protein FlgA